jgi:hypothetical protein
MFSVKERNEIVLNKRGIGPKIKNEETIDPSKPLMMTTALLSIDAIG